MGPTVPCYCCPNRHRMSLVFHSWNKTFWTADFLGCSPNINTSWRKGHRKERLIWPYDAFPGVWCPGFIVVTPSYLSFTLSNQRFSKSTPTVDVGFFKLTSDSFCGNSYLKMSFQFCCHLFCSSSVIFQKNPSQCMIISVNFDIRLLYLFADVVFPDSCMPT